MLQILFSGSGATLSKLQAALMGYAAVMLSGRGDVQVCEIRNVDDLKTIPQNPSAPLFLIVSTQNKTVMDQLKGFRISGIFFPPLDGSAIKRKFDTVKNIKVVPVENTGAGDIDTLKIKILAKAETITALPVFAQKLLKLTRSDSATIQEITDQIKMDQGISGKVMRMVNSPFYGLRQDMNSIDRAVVLLGFNTLKNIALVAATNAYYNKGFEMYQTNGTALWTHAYNVAVISEEFARESGEDPESLFLAGLLHDIGKILLVDFLVQPVYSFSDEQRQLGLDHAEVAGFVLKRWQLPEDIINTVMLHHEPDDSIPSQIVYYANLLDHASRQDRHKFIECLEFAFRAIPMNNKDGFSKKLFTMLIAKKESVQ